MEYSVKLTTMEFYHLQSFVTVANEGSIKKASQRLHITPPTVSGHIKALEEDFLITLFERKPRGMALTNEGQLLLKQAEKIIASTRSLHNQVAELRNCVSGKFVIGLNAPPALLKVAQFASEITKNPNIEISFEPSSTGKIIESLLTGKFDAGYVFSEISKKEISSIYLTTVDLCIAIPTTFKHRLKYNGWKELAQLPWICSDGYCPFQEIAKKLFENKGYSLLNTISTNDELTKLDLVRQGLGGALLLAEECKSDVSTGGIFTWETEPIQCKLYFSFLAEKKNDPVFRILRKAIYTAWNKTDS